MVSFTRRQALKTMAGASAIGLSGMAGCLGGEEEDVFDVAALEPVTGPFAEPGTRGLRGMRIAAEMANEEGGVNGREIELHHIDTEADPSVASRRLENLIEEENPEMILGTFSSGTALAIAPIAARREIPYIAGYAATIQLTGNECNPYTFRGTRNEPDMQWMHMTPYLMEEEDITSVAVCYADYAWGQDMTQVIEMWFDEMGGEVTDTIGAELGATDFAPYLDGLDFDDADGVIFINAGADAVNFMSDAAGFGVHEDHRIITVGAGTEEYLDDTGVPEEFLENTVGITYYHKELSGELDHEGNREFHELYMEEEPEGRPPTRPVVPRYESVWSVVEAAEAADYEGPDDVDDLLWELANLEMEASLRYPGGDKFYRPDDHQCVVDQYIYEFDGYDEVNLAYIPADESAGASAQECGEDLHPGYS